MEKSDWQFFDTEMDIILRGAKSLFLRLHKILNKKILKDLLYADTV
jgi:hypothetical protein